MNFERKWNEKKKKYFNSNLTIGMLHLLLKRKSPAKFIVCRVDRY